MGEGRRVTTPNLYQFATSELSQDATLAYILSWAKPEYRETAPALNTLGVRLLRALVDSSARAQGIANPLENVAITALRVATQQDCIDVWAEINDAVFLLIEDKVDSAERNKQVARYLERAAQYRTARGNPWKTMPVYVKTGNESGPHVISTTACGVFLREHLLAVLSQVPDTGNAIVEEFRSHLQSWQDETESYLTMPYTDWAKKAKAIQGYYMVLETWLRDRHRQLGIAGDCDASWKYVPNAANGFLGFYWHWQRLESHRCKLYLQIHNGTHLQVRVSDALDEAGAHVKATGGLLWNVYSRLQECVTQERVTGFAVTKSGDFRGGSTAGLADIHFEVGKGTYLATDDQGVVDLSATQKRLLLAMQLVDAVCAEGGGGVTP